MSILIAYLIIGLIMGIGACIDYYDGYWCNPLWLRVLCVVIYALLWPYAVWYDYKWVMVESFQEPE